jgi:hypothetical protein
MERESGSELERESVCVCACMYVCACAWPSEGVYECVDPQMNMAQGRLLWTKRASDSFLISFDLVIDVSKRTQQDKMMGANRRCFFVFFFFFFLLFFQESSGDSTSIKQRDQEETDHPVVPFSEI